MKKVTVVGGGGTGHAVSAELSRRGFEVRLCDHEDYRGILEETKRLGEITLNGSLGHETASIQMVTTDIAAALEGADVVICCTIANRDEQVARMIAPHLKEGQAVLLSAGNGGSIIYRRIFDELGVKGVVVGETSGNLFPCRLTGPGQVLIGLPYLVKKVAAYPASETGKLIRAFEEIYEFKPARHVLEAVFNAPNLIGHIAVTLLNAGAIENSKETYYVFRQGICPSVLNLTDAMWEEKKRVMDALGLTASPPSSKMFSKLMDESCHEYDNFKALAGPNSVRNRYISEDTPCMMCLFISVAHALDIPVPLFESLVKVASAVNQVDYYKEGRTLENLGLSHLKGQELIDFFSKSESSL